MVRLFLVQLFYIHHFYTKKHPSNGGSSPPFFAFDSCASLAGVAWPRPPRDPWEPSKPRALPARTPSCGGGEGTRCCLKCSKSFVFGVWRVLGEEVRAAVDGFSE